jgi:hypothetical protein
MTIAGPGPGALTISGHHASRIFDIHLPGTNPAPPVFISGLTLTQGNAGNSIGGAISSVVTTLWVIDSIIRDSTADYGGGIGALGGGNVEIIASRLTRNLAAKSGGSLYAEGDDIFLSGTSVDGNTAGVLGGGIRIPYGTRLASGIHDQRQLVPQPSSKTSTRTVVAGSAQLGWLVCLFLQFHHRTELRLYQWRRRAVLDGLTADRTTFLSCTIVGNTAQFDETGIGISSAADLVRDVCHDRGKQCSVGSNVADDLAGRFIVNWSLIKNPGSASMAGTDSLIVDPRLVSSPTTAANIHDAAGDNKSGHQRSVLRPIRIMCLRDQRGALRATADLFEDMGAVERQYPEDLFPQRLQSTLTTLRYPGSASGLGEVQCKRRG